ncbi:hypothetical protein ACHAWF_016287 [Thalassiosira exigua]
MADFHRRNLTWTLLVDVDEYITFNRVHDDDPAPPLDAAPEGVPTLAGWTRKEFNLVDPETHEVVSEVHIEGTASGLPEGGLNGTKNGDHVTFTSKNYSYEYDTTYGNVVDDARTDGRWFLRDDHAFRDMVELTAAPSGLPTLRDARFVRGDVLSAKIYNDTYSGRRDGEVVEVRTLWRESPDGTSTALGGHLMHAEDGRTYFVERRRPLWPPLFTSEKALEIRNRLPSVGDDTTILDILEGESEGERFAEVVGPCLSMPRLLYGPHEREKDADGQGETLPDGFDRHDFVTLRYRWHAAKEARANKFQKVIIDVSRMSARNFLGEAKNIHVPLHYYCRKYPPRYSTSFFRVNHYLDSFEAFSYRNDARSSKRCKECWEEKGKDAAAFMDDDMAPWLNSFVHAMGHQKAKDLLSGAGNFVQLPLT